MFEDEELKIDDVYVFYFSSGYVNAQAEEERTVAEILGVETQEEVDALVKENLKYVEECFDQEYNDFLINQDSGWYKK